MQKERLPHDFRRKKLLELKPENILAVVSMVTCGGGREHRRHNVGQVTSGGTTQDRSRPLPILDRLGWCRLATTL